MRAHDKLPGIRHLRRHGLTRCTLPSSLRRTTGAPTGREDADNIFEMGTNAEGGPMLKHLDLGDASPVEVRQAQSVNGPLAVLNDYYDVYVTQPDDAKWRLDNMHEVYLDDMHSKYVYPNVFMSIDDTNRVSQLDTDIKKYAGAEESGLDLKRRDRGRVGRISPEDGRLRPVRISPDQAEIFRQLPGVPCGNGSGIF